MPSRTLSLLFCAALLPSCAALLLGVDDDHSPGSTAGDAGVIASVPNSVKPGVDGTCPSAFKKCGELCVSVVNPAYGCGATACGSACPVPPSNGAAVCEANACEVQCVGGFHVDGANCVADTASPRAGTWRVVPSGTTQDLTGIWGVGANEVWAVGKGGTLVIWNGAAWASAPNAKTEFLYGTWGMGKSEVWGTTSEDANAAQRWNGSAWSHISTPDIGNSISIWGTSRSNLWIGGMRGLARWNGTSWSGVAGAAIATAAIKGVGAADIWAVGGLRYGRSEPDSSGNTALEWDRVGDG